MKKKLITYTAVAALAIFSVACKKNKIVDLTLNIDGLENLGSDFVYEGWIIVDDAPVTTGTFTVDDAGVMSSTTFDVNQKSLEDASTFILTIEPAVDADASPSNVHILAGDFSDDNASLTVSHTSALGNDFTNATGKYILATPTNGEMTDENSGVWWLDPTAGPGAGLDLPTLPAGWAYEGWAVIDGTPVSTGTFSANSGVDNGAPFSGAMAGPAFPGEDFLENAPDGVSFPTDLAGQTVVISVEPMPDNSTNPFTLKPLVGGVPATAVDHTPYTMDNNATATNPTGTAQR
ncbi:MAG: hypothetical protein ACI8ZM_003220 [Crocinitomix sp.]|jgi:hypothetical protein